MNDMNNGSSIGDFDGRREAGNDRFPSGRQPVTAAEIPDRIRDVLHGLGRADRTALDGLRDVRDWAGAAKAELRLRATRVLEVLDDDALELIANGDVSFRDLCIEASSKLAKPTS